MSEKDIEREMELLRTMNISQEAIKKFRENQEKKAVETVDDPTFDRFEIVRLKAKRKQVLSSLFTTDGPCWNCGQPILELSQFDNIDEEGGEDH